MFGLCIAGCDARLGELPHRPTDDSADSAERPSAPQLRRLTGLEYLTALERLTGPVEELAVPEDPSSDGFDNDAAALSVEALHFETYRANAERIAAQVMASAERRAQVVGCEPIGGARDTCTREFARTFGARAYRRPLSDEEIEELVGLAATVPADVDPYGGVRLVLEATLVAPSFLFRTEIGEPADGGRVLVREELATRLSFFLLGEPPDDALLARAAAGELETDEGLRTVATEMLADPRSVGGIERLTDRWFRLALLDVVERSAENYPMWGPSLKAAMLVEARALIAEAVAGDGDFVDALLLSRRALIGPELAPIYGLAPPAELGWYELPADRAGLLTRAATLTITSPTTIVAPILRGLYAREVLLCDEVPDPPNDVGEIPTGGPVTSERERLIAHRSNTRCAACHARLDPVGFGLEHYGAIGEWRERDMYGAPLTGTGHLDGVEYTGARELSERIADDPRVRACAAGYAMRYAFGRELSAYDEPARLAIGARASEGSGSFRELLLAIVTDPSFREALGGTR